MVQLWWVSRSGSSRGTNLLIIANHHHYCIQLPVLVACALFSMSYNIATSIRATCYQQLATSKAKCLHLHCSAVTALQPGHWNRLHSKAICFLWRAWLTTELLPLCMFTKRHSLLDSVLSAYCMQIHRYSVQFGRLQNQNSTYMVQSVCCIAAYR